MSHVIFKKLLLLLMFSPLFALWGCSDDDDFELDQSDFIEVTVNGKTVHKPVVRGLYVTDDGRSDLSFTASMQDVFHGEPFDLGYILIHYSSKEALLKCKPGRYGFTDDILDEENQSNFDLSLIYEDKESCYEDATGIHNVTAIQAVENGVVVEGNFDAELEDDQYNTVRVKGKYRMTLYL